MHGIGEEMLTRVAYYSRATARATLSPSVSTGRRPLCRRSDAVHSTPRFMGANGIDRLQVALLTIAFLSIVALFAVDLYG